MVYVPLLVLVITTGILNLLQSIYWMIKCLYAGQLIPLEEKGNSRRPPAIELQRHVDPMELSQEL